MDVDEDDDFYASEEGADATKEQPEKAEEDPQSNAKPVQEDEDLEEGEEEDEADSDGSDSVCANIEGCRANVDVRFRT